MRTQTSNVPGRRPRRPRRRLAVTAITAVVGLLLVAAAPVPVAVATAPPVTITHVQPTDGSTLYLARTTPRTLGGEPGWQLKLDVRFRNDAGEDLTIGEVRISYPGSAVSDTSYRPYRWVNNGTDAAPAWEKLDQTVEPGKRTTVRVFDGLRNVNNETDFVGREHVGTPPPAVHVEIDIDGYDEPLVYDFDLELYENDTPTGGVFFPARASDMAAGEYLNFDTRHIVDNGGQLDISPATFNQRYGVDMGIVRHTGSYWTGLTPAGETKVINNGGYDGADLKNEDYLVWELPVYAIGDGVVVECAKGHEDHDFTGRFPTPEERNDDPTTEENEDVFGGNLLVIEMGDERIEYAHLKAGSIPDELCPGAPTFEPIDGLSIPVTAGTQIGEVGNNGNSTAPHFHLHLTRNGGTDGVPFNWLNIRSANDETGWWNLPANPTLERTDGMSLSSYSLVRPNECGFAPPSPGNAEQNRAGIPGECWQDVSNVLYQQGYRPTTVDAYDVAGDSFFNGAFRSSPLPTIARHGLDRVAYDELFDQLTASGWKLLDVDSYRDGSGLDRYAPIFVPQDGPSFRAVHFETLTQIEEEMDWAAANGFAPVLASTVFVDGQDRYTALFQHQPNISTWHIDTVPESSYQALFDTRTAAGLALYDIDAYDRDGTPYITAVFVSGVTSGWQARHGDSFAAYRAHVLSTVPAGNLTRAIAGYEVGGAHRYAGLWRPRVDTTITSAPPALTNSDDATFTFRASDPFSVFQCRQTPTSVLWGACSSATSHTDLPDGSQTFQVRAIDRAALRDPSPASHSWFVDTTAPVVTLDRPAQGEQYIHDVLDATYTGTETRAVGDLTVVATATDTGGSGVASVVFTVDGVPVPGTDVTHDPTTDTWSFVYSPEKGRNTVTIGVAAVDHATNAASTSRDVVTTGTGGGPK